MRTGAVVMVVLGLTALAGPAVAGAQSAAAPAEESTAGPAPQVRGVLFYSPQCPHCHDVMRDHLPPLMRAHGESLRIVAVNVDTPEGQAVYRAVVAHFQLPRQRLGVPALVVGDRVMVGSGEIPAQLPGLVEAGLAGAGVDWPDVAEVRLFLARQGIAAGGSMEPGSVARPSGA
jgi:hypothetical protein